MLKTIVSLHFIFCVAFIVPQTAPAAQSKAQLFLPWPMLNAKMNEALSDGQSQFKTKVPSFILTAGDLNWQVSNISSSAQSAAPFIRTDGNEISFESAHTSLSIQIESISVDQIVERVIAGALVRVHLTASCGPFTLTQPQAEISSHYKLTWKSGSPAAEFTASHLSWKPHSWTLNNFKCTGPEGLPEILKSEITEHIASAEVFKPYLTEFLTNQVHSIIQNSLKRIREPLTLQAGSSHQTFKVGALVNLPQGIIVDLTVSDLKDSTLLPVKEIPSNEILNSLSSTTPSLLAGKDLLEQIIRSELAMQPSRFTTDLQNHKEFSKLMKNRFKQFFGWADLLHYPKKAPFPVTLFKPELSSLELSKTGRLQTNIFLNSVIQSYRAEQWWSWILINGEVLAEVDLTISEGVIGYRTSLTPQTVKLVYSPEYKKRFKKSGTPPSKKVLSAVAGEQPGLSGNFKFPIVEFGATVKYKLSSLKWLDSQSFVLNWKED